MIKAEEPLEEIECLLVHQGKASGSSFEQWVNARELYRFLALERDYFWWLDEREKGGGFDSGRDFVKVDGVASDNDPDYHLSLDMALIYGAQRVQRVWSTGSEIH